MNANAGPEARQVESSRVELSKKTGWAWVAAPRGGTGMNKKTAIQTCLSWIFYAAAAAQYGEHGVKSIKSNQNELMDVVVERGGSVRQTTAGLAVLLLPPTMYSTVRYSPAGHVRAC